MAAQHRRASISSIVVTADQMQRIEANIFERGMPVPALMEKVAGRIADWIMARFPCAEHPLVGVLVGPGHNGGDALVVARELWFQGYRLVICCPLERQKELTANHLQFIRSLGIPVSSDFEALEDCAVLIDGLFGFGLGRPLEGYLAAMVDQINCWPQPVISIDLPSGLHTDTGEVLGTAITATHTLCLGLWKRAFCQSGALSYVGEPHLIDFDIPNSVIYSVLAEPPQVQKITLATVRQRLPLPRMPDTHKYRVGHLLVVAGSRQFAGAAILAGLGARASGVGMLTMAVPESLRLAVVGQLPEALVWGCPEDDTGSIAELPTDLDLEKYDAIACGPGLTRQAQALLRSILDSPKPLVLDADGLNLLADLSPLDILPKRTAPTLLTPHPGEFKRLFPELDAGSDAGDAALTAAHHSRAVIVLKGACTAVAHPNGRLWFMNDSTPALARGGSGDILTGLIGGLLTQQVATVTESSLDGALEAAIAGTWWHAKAAQLAAIDCTQLGVDPKTLATYLNPALAEVMR